MEIFSLPGSSFSPIRAGARLPGSLTDRPLPKDMLHWPAFPRVYASHKCTV